MHDWLGNDKPPRKPIGGFWTFEKAREFVRGLGLTSHRHYRNWTKTDARPAAIPAEPENVYWKQWTSWPDFLGKHPAPHRGRWRPFEKAREFVQAQGFQSYREYKAWAKTEARPPDIPTTPELVYKGKGWVDFGDWLGTGRAKPRDREWRSFEKAREFVQAQGFQSYREYHAWAKTEARPPDIPTAPDAVYKGKGWVSWPDFLGYEPRYDVVWTKTALLALLEDLRPRLPHMDERELYAILQQGGALSVLRNKLGKSTPLQVINDLKENGGGQIKEAIEAASEAAAGALEPEPEEEEEGDATLRTVATDTPPEFEEEPLVDTTGGLPTLVTNEALRTVDAVADMRCGLDHETAEYLVGIKVAALWDATINGNREAVENHLKGEGGHYFNLIRSRFYAELEAVENLQIPAGWSFEVDGVPAPPNLMQKRTAWLVRERGRVGNWSGTGSGKTLSGILASRVSNCMHTLVICNNATVEGWCREIGRAYPDSVVQTVAGPPVEGRHTYTVLNYEKFQTGSRTALAKRLLEHGVDFVILDELQLVKQRVKSHRSMRRRSVEAVITLAAESNPALKVLGMSATPVINNLLEARKLLEMVTGTSFADLDTKATVNNALAMHRALMVNGFRYRPRYEIEVHTETVETMQNDLLGDLLEAEGVLGVEQAVLPAKLDAARPYFEPGTLVYTHYTQGMVHPIRSYLEDMGYRVGLYTGTDKSGLEPFLSGRVGILIGSRPVGTGLDGLQKRCNRVVMLSPPWTGAEYEQLIGRLRRQGSAFREVSVVAPQVVLERSGEAWSWDRGRMALIEYKRTLSDCAVDGRIPETVRISEAALLRHSRKALEEWIRRVKEEGPLELERSRLQVPLPPDIRKAVQRKHGDFSAMNNRWARTDSKRLHERLQDNPEEWYLYHDYYRKARQDWPEIPAKHIAKQLEARPDWKVGDFGCGECILRDALPNHEVLSFDHVAIDETVTVCDMAHTALEDGALGAAVFSLSLMGKNWAEYLAEAYRTLQPFGVLFVAEPAERWEKGALEGALVTTGFEVVQDERRDSFRYVAAMKAR